MKQIICAVLFCVAIGVCSAQTSTTGTTEFESTTYPSRLSIESPSLGTIVTITYETGAVEFGKNYTPAAAAEVFWTSLGEESPRALKARIAELEKQLAEAKKCKAVLREMDGKR